MAIFKNPDVEPSSSLDGTLWASNTVSSDSASWHIRTVALLAAVLL